MDVVIPLGSNDVDIIQKTIDSCYQYIEEIKNLFVISFDESISLKNCIVVKEFFNNEVKSIFPNDNRYKWYLQQLIKLYAHQYIPQLSDDYLVVDADTIFYKRMKYREDGKYWFQIEKRSLDSILDSYYSHAKRVHPTLVSPFPNHFFIHHHMIFNRHLLVKLFELVESLHHKPFWFIFLTQVDKKEYFKNGASEYEIYAIYMNVYHPGRVMTRNLQYEQIINLNSEVDANSYWVNYHFHWLLQIATINEYQ